MFNNKGNTLFIIMVVTLLISFLIANVMGLADFVFQKKEVVSGGKERTLAILSETDSDLQLFQAFKKTLEGYFARRSFCTQSLKQSDVTFVFNKTGSKNLTQIKSIKNNSPAGAVVLSGKPEEGWSSFEISKNSSFGHFTVGDIDFTIPSGLTQRYGNFKARTQLEVGLKKGTAEIAESPVTLTVKVELEDCTTGSTNISCKVASCYGDGGVSFCQDGNLLFYDDVSGNFRCSNDLNYNVGVYHFERVMPCYEVKESSIPNRDKDYKTTLPKAPFKADITEISSSGVISTTNERKACATMVDNIDSNWNFTTTTSAKNLRPMSEVAGREYKQDKNSVSALSNFNTFKSKGYLIDKITYTPKFSGKLNVRAYVPILWYEGYHEHAFIALLSIRDANCVSGDTQCDSNKVHEIGVGDICNPFNISPQGVGTYGCWGIVWGDYFVEQGRSYEIFLTMGSVSNGSRKVLAGTVKFQDVYMEGVWDLTEYTAPINVD